MKKASKWKIKDVLASVAESETYEYEPGASAEDIAETEKECGHKLPADYVEFIKKYNGGDFTSARLYKVAFGDALEILASLLGEENTQGLVPFGDDYSGVLYCFDYRRYKKGDVPVVMITDSSEIEPAAGSFTELMAQGYIDLDNQLSADLAVPGFRKLAYSSLISVPALKKYNVKIQLIDPAMLDDPKYDIYQSSFDNDQPPHDLARTVAFRVFPDKGPNKEEIRIKYQSEYITRASGEKLTSPGSGTKPLQLDTYSLVTVRYLTMKEKLSESDILNLTIEIITA